MRPSREEVTVVENGVLPPGVGSLLGASFIKEHGAELGLRFESFAALPPITCAPRFEPPDPAASPEALFQPTISKCSIPAPRYTRISNPQELLIYTDGACSDNGREDPAAGCAFVFRPATSKAFACRGLAQGRLAKHVRLDELGAESFRLESCGPDNEPAPQTSNRAELRAIIAALQYRVWSGEGFNRLIIATDSAYCVDGVTKWIGKWQHNGWLSSTRKPVKNKDLWVTLMEIINKRRADGLDVLFWHIPRHHNTLADGLAKEAAKLPACEKWTTLKGIAC